MVFFTRSVAVDLRRVAHRWWPDLPAGRSARDKPFAGGRLEAELAGVDLATEGRYDTRVQWWVFVPLAIVVFSLRHRPTCATAHSWRDQSIHSQGDQPDRHTIVPRTEHLIMS